jgi:hypothetical protein
MNTLYIVVLTVHILGAIVTGLVGGFSLYAVLKGVAEKYRTSALALGALAAFEVVTGAFLAVISVEISAAAICSRVFIYLSFVAIVEMLLFNGMKKSSQAFPMRIVVSPILASLGVLCAAVAYGF